MWSSQSSPQALNQTQVLPFDLALTPREKESTLLIIPAKFYNFHRIFSTLRSIQMSDDGFMSRSGIRIKDFGSSAETQDSFQTKIIIYSTTNVNLETIKESRKSRSYNRHISCACSYCCWTVYYNLFILLNNDFAISEEKISTSSSNGEYLTVIINVWTHC